MYALSSILMSASIASCRRLLSATSRQIDRDDYPIYKPNHISAWTVSDLDLERAAALPIDMDDLHLSGSISAVDDSDVSISVEGPESPKQDEENEKLPVLHFDWKTENNMLHKHQCDQNPEFDEKERKAPYSSVQLLEDEKEQATPDDLQTFAEMIRNKKDAVDPDLQKKLADIEQEIRQFERYQLEMENDSAHDSDESLGSSEEERQRQAIEAADREE